MFQLSLVDHIRLSFGSVATSYRSHARAAERLSGRARHSRVVLVTLLSLSTGASLVALSGLRSFQIAAAALSITALAGLAIVYALDFEARAFAHRACAAQLWLLCEKTAPCSPTSTTDSSICPKRPRGATTSCAKCRTSTSTRFPLIARPIGSRKRPSGPALGLPQIKTSTGSCPPRSARRPCLVDVTNHKCQHRQGRNRS